MTSPSFNRESPLFRHRQLAPTASVRVSPLCLGTMTFGEALAERYGKCNKEEAFRIMDHFYNEGGNFIDTANFYRNGEAETWVGEWLSARNNRDDMVLATKYTGAYLAHDPQHIQSNYSGTGAKSMRLSLEASLAKLQTSYIDLFYVHWWDYTTKIPELMHSLNDLIVSGKVLYLGISDTPAWVVSMANEYARNYGLRPFSVYQGMWNAGTRDFERDIIPMCVQQGMALCPWGVLGQGRFQTAEAYKEREKHKEGRNGMPLSEHDKKISRVLNQVAKEKGCDLLQVALAYVQQKVPYVFSIVGQRKLHHLQGSIAALSVSLSEADIEKIERTYVFDHGFPHTMLSGTMYDRSATQKQVQGPEDVALTKVTGTYDWVEGPKALRPPQ